MFGLDKGREHGLPSALIPGWGLEGGRLTCWILAYTPLTYFLKNRNLRRLSRALELCLLAPVLPAISGGFSSRVPVEALVACSRSASSSGSFVSNSGITV